ncbi:MAG: hypothetical protein IPH09_11260 [bacterium]|nr:hypothetical protein [bacterium]
MAWYPLRRALCAIACSMLTAAAAPVAAQTDLSALFAPPPPAEVAAVAQDWAGRLPTPTDWKVVRTGVDDATGFTVQAVSHEIEGFTHYGGLRYPRLWTQQGRFPVLVLLHGGFDGLTLDFLVNFDANFPAAAFADSFLVVAPTFRSEPLNGGQPLGIRISGGEPSPFDRDCDDTMALLTAVLLNIPQADPGYVVVLGAAAAATWPTIWPCATRACGAPRSATVRPTSSRTTCAWARRSGSTPGIPGDSSAARWRTGSPGRGWPDRSPWNRRGRR